MPKLLLNTIHLIAAFTLTAQEIIPTDRRIDWNPGVPGGIPDYPVGVNVVDFGAVSDGMTDNFSAFQSAIDVCASGQAVYVPEGDYRLNNGIRITKDVVLRGAGPTQTRLLFYRDPGDTSPNIYIGSNIQLANQHPVLSGFEKGSTLLELNSVSGLIEGDLLFLTQDNDGDFVTNIGAGGVCTWCGDQGKCLGQMLLISNVNTETNTIQFEPALYWTYTSGLNPYVEEVQGAIQYAGLEDVYVDNVFEQTVISIRMQGIRYSWIKNIESNYGQRHIEVDLSYRCEIRDSYLRNHHNYVPNHYCLLMGTFSTANLVENNIFYNTKGGTMLVGWGAAGNVFGYNYTKYTWYQNSYMLEAELNHHGGHPMMNLWEGNTAQMLQADSYWGSISHNTFYRNFMKRELEMPDRALYNRYAMILQSNCTHFNVLGNVMGFPGMEGIYEVENQTASGSTAAIYKLGYTTFGDNNPEGNDPEVKETLLRHGNFNYIDNATRWDPDISNHELPPSLYLDSKPAFFGTTPWPPVGPDVSGYTQKIPAQNRFEAMVNADHESPDIPQNLEVSPVSETQLELTWTPSRDNVGITAYRIYVNGVEIDTTSLTTYPINDRAIPRIYTVSAYDAAGNESDPSDPVADPEQVIFQVKVFLEGPYDSGNMSGDLRTGGHLPLQSPYDDASVSSIPADVVDWVQVTLRTQADGSGTNYHKSAFVRNDGIVVDLDGSAYLTMTAPENAYFIRVRHRNHLPVMSDEAIHLSNQ